MKTRIQVIFLACLLLLGMVGCASSSPTAVVRSFYNAVNDGNYEKAVSMFSSSAIDNFGIDKLTSMISMQADQLAMYGGVKKFTVTDETIVGDNAVVYYEMEMNDGSVQSGSASCVKEDGKWKIDIGK